MLAAAGTATAQENEAQAEIKLMILCCHARGCKTTVLVVARSHARRGTPLAFAPPNIRQK
jgi:hypothetical protein